MKPIISIFFVLAVQGCASALYQDISGKDLQSVKSSSVVIKYYQAPPFVLMTPKDIVGEGLVARLTGSSGLPPGTALVKTYAIQDPTVMLAAETKKTFGAQGIKIAGIDDKKLPLPVKEATQYPEKSDYVLELNTPAWLANYLPMNWKTYAFVVRGAGRLIRTSDQAVVWKGYCYHGGYEDERLKFDISEFEKNNAQKVKQALEIGTKVCAGQLAEQLTKAK